LSADIKATADIAIRIDPDDLPLKTVCVSRWGGRLLNDAICAGVLSGSVLKPEDDSRSSCFAAYS